MPGKGGIVPDQNSFSVPVEMPEWAISHHHVARAGAVSPGFPAPALPLVLTG
jgi:hypothetical protein